jgi:hypothetical protein
MKIADWMFRETCIFYKENGEIPNEEVAKQIIDRIYEKLKSLAIWVPYEEVYRAYLLKLPRYELRIAENGIPEEKPPKEKKEDVPKKKKGSSNKRCPVCGRRMKQQFIGLQHCKCGMSWKKDIGFFERTGDMVFALERRKIGNKQKQCPVIRYKE